MKQDKSTIYQVICCFIVKVFVSLENYNVRLKYAVSANWRAAEIVRKKCQQEFPQYTWMASLHYGDPCAVAITNDGAIKSEKAGNLFGYRKLSEIDLELNRVEVLVPITKRGLPF